MATARESSRDIDDRTEDLRDLVASHPDIFKDFQSQYELSWIYHENAMEGIVLTHAELTSALKGRPIAPETYGDIRGMRLGIDLTRREAMKGGRVDMALIRRLRSVLGSHETNFEPSEYRKDIPLHRAYFHEISQPTVIADRMNKLMDWAAENDPEDDDAVRFAAHLHHEFMSIFPFSKHTGKTGRMLVNYVLLRHGYMPVVWHATERQKYYDTLRQTKKQMEGALNDMMANCVENASKYIEQVLVEREKEAVRGRNQFAVV